MDIPKGEYIGKTVYKRTTDPAPKEEDAEYCHTFVNSNLDETDSAGKSNRYSALGTYRFSDLYSFPQRG